MPASSLRVTDKNAQAASPPTLAKNARMGHPLWKWCGQASHQSWATRPHLSCVSEFQRTVQGDEI